MKSFKLFPVLLFLQLVAAVFRNMTLLELLKLPM